MIDGLQSFRYGILSPGLEYSLSLFLWVLESIFCCYRQVSNTAHRASLFFDVPQQHISTEKDPDNNDKQQIVFTHQHASLFASHTTMTLTGFGSHDDDNELDQKDLENGTAPSQSTITT